MRVARLVGAVLAGVLMAPLLSRAQGTITGVTPKPAPGVACKLNTIQINGTGMCGTAGQANGFTLNLGDGTPLVHLPGRFPILVYHSYSHAGSFTLTAEAETKCHGIITTGLQVIGPAITSIFPFSVIKPGGGVLLRGTNFGNLPGQILIKFQNQLFGTPLENIQWGDTFAAGTIPSNISGVPDQEVTFTVVAQCGAVSNELPAFFTATRDLVAVPLDRITCSTSVGAGNSQKCQNWGQSNFPLECGWSGNFGTQPGPTGFFGYHASGWGFSGLTGNDQFWPSPSLANGWVLDSFSDLAWTKIGDGSFATEVNPSPAGTPNPSIGVNWKADNCGLIMYSGDMFITGPLGVAY